MNMLKTITLAHLRQSIAEIEGNIHEEEFRIERAAAKKDRPALDAAVNKLRRAKLDLQILETQLEQLEKGEQR